MPGMFGLLGGGAARGMAICRYWDIVCDKVQCECPHLLVVFINIAVGGKGGVGGLMHLSFYQELVVHLSSQVT